MANPTRTDCHRPGLIVPAHYSPLCSYALGNATCPAINIQQAREILANFPKFGREDRGFSLGSCSVCGASFVYGDIWLHEPSGEVVTLGHDCADKYEMLMDRSEFELSVERAKQARAVEIIKAEKAEAREAFLTANPGLESALECTHPIVQDIKARFTQYCKLSTAQIALVLKLDNEVRNPRPAEAHVPAPTGRMTFTGEIVSAKIQDSDFGSSYKITVKMQTPEGSWLAWGTCPAALLVDENGYGVSLASLKGQTVTIKATLKPGRDAHFAVMSRPAKG